MVIVLSVAGIPAAVEEAWSSGGVLTDGSSGLQLRNAVEDFGL